MTPEVTNQVTAGLLLLNLGSVLVVFSLLALWVVLYTKRKRPRAELPTRKEERKALSHPPPFFPSTNGLPCRWSAIKSSNLPAVQAVLGLHNPMPCTWSEGVSRLTNHTLFIAPPIRGWILVIGQGLPDPFADVDKCFHFVQKLSRALGHVQFFSADRAVNHHAWVKAEDGQIQRAYAWAGETLWNQGKKTQAEIDLGLKCFSYAEPADITFLGKESHHANAEKVALLAAHWSIDLSTIEESMLPARPGISGELTHSR